MDNIVIGLTLLTVFTSIGGAAGTCVHVENDDMLEYSCDGGDPRDLDTIPSVAEKIRISNMRIPIIKSDMFSRFGPTLWVLSCSHCGIEDIEPDAFRELKNLQQLSLDNNRLKIVKGAWFKSFEDLTYLDLNYNEITKIEDEVFEKLASLVDFRISGNRFECLNTIVMEHLQHLKRMFLSENPELKCPNAISEFLEYRDITFDRDPEWKDIDEVSVTEVPISTTSEDERRAYWLTTPPYREMSHLPPVVASTQDTRSSYHVSPERTPTPEVTRYPLYAPVSGTTVNYRDLISHFPSIVDSSPVTTTGETNVPQYRLPSNVNPYHPYLTTPQPSRYPSTQPWPPVSEVDDTTDYSKYYEPFGYSEEVSGTPSLAPSLIDRGGLSPLLDPRNTPSTEPPEITWTKNGILIEPNYPLPNPTWDPRLNGETTEVIPAEDSQVFSTPFTPPPPPPPPYVARPQQPELVQPAAPSDFLQVPYYEPTMTVRPPPPPPPPVFQNYGEQSTMVVPLETTTDLPLPDCPRGSSPSGTLSIKETITFIIFVFIANIIV